MNLTVRFLKRVIRQPVALVAATWLSLVVAASLTAPVLAPYDPEFVDITKALEPPSREHLLGTDDIGRDVLSRLVFAGRISLMAAIMAVGVAVAIGLPLGLISGYFGGWVDQVIMRINDTLMSFPALILAVALIGFLGPSLRNAMLAVGLVFAPRIMRVVRGSTLSVREEDYIAASRVTGATPFFIAHRHLLRNIASPVIVQVTLSVGIAMLAESSLSFLGLGVQPPQASWGSMLRRGFSYMQFGVHLVLAPGLVLMSVVLALNVLGDALRDALGRDPGRVQA